MVRGLVAWCGPDRESAHDFRFSPRIQPIPQIDESTAFSEVYADAQNSIACAAMLANQSVARGCRLANHMGPKQESIPDTRSSPVIWRGRQSGNESGHQPANQPIICPKYQSSISPITAPSS